MDVGGLEPRLPVPHRQEAVDIELLAFRSDFLLEPRLQTPQLLQLLQGGTCEQLQVSKNPSDTLDTFLCLRPLPANIRGCLEGLLPVQELSHDPKELVSDSIKLPRTPRTH